MARSRIERPVSGVEAPLFGRVLACPTELGERLVSAALDQRGIVLVTDPDRLPRVRRASDGEASEDGRDVADAAAVAVASSEAAAGGAGDAGSATSEPAAERRALREARAVPFRESCAGVMAQMEGLREAASSLHSPRQRMLAKGVLRRLATLEPMIEQAAAADVTPGAAALEELARELGPPDDILGSTGTSPPDPTFVTRDRHRREIPRVP